MHEMAHCPANIGETTRQHLGIWKTYEAKEYPAPRNPTIVRTGVDVIEMKKRCWGLTKKG